MATGKESLKLKFSIDGKYCLVPNAGEGTISVYDRHSKKQIKISKLFSWYLGDFGGTAGVLSFLKKYDVIKPSEKPQIIYSKYNWDSWIK